MEAAGEQSSAIPNAPVGANPASSWAARLRDHPAVVLVFVALVARVAYWALVTPDYVPHSDAAQYMEIARNVAAGRGFEGYFPQLALHPTAFRPPVYPTLLGGAFFLFGTDVVVGRVLNLVIGLVVVGLAWKLGDTIAGARAGFWAGLVVALYPPLIANDVVLLTEPLSLALLLGIFLALARRRVALAGAVCGLLVLTRPSAQYLVIVVGLWVLWRIGWRRALLFVAVAGIVVVPWVVRNWVVLGAPVLVTSNGFNLAAIYSPEARASGSFVDPVFDHRFKGQRLDQFDEIVWQRHLTERALDSLRSDPDQVLPVLKRNVLAYFELTPGRNDSPEALDGRNLDFRPWTLPVFYVVTAVGLAGLWVRRRDHLVQLMMLVLGYFVLASLVFVAPPRLRAPFDLICCLGVGFAIAAFRDRRELERRPDADGGVVATP